MPFVAGSIIGYAELDDSKFNAGVNSVIGSSDKMEKSLKSDAQQIETTHKKMGQSIFTSMFTAQAAYHGFIKVLNFTKDKIIDSISNSSDLQENTSKFNVVFNGVTKDAKIMRDSLVSAYGMSRLESTKTLASFQDFLVPMGITRNKALELSGAFTKLGVDIGSFNNAPTEQVLNAIKSALAGQSEPMRQFGVDISENTLKLMAQSEGINLVNGTLDRQTRAQLIYKKIVKDSGDALGDFARTSTGFANQNKIINAGLMDLSSNLGDSFIPILEKGQKVFIGLISGMNNFLTAGQNLKNVKAEQSELNNLATRLMSVNDNQELRNATIKELNSKYPGFLRNMNTENLTLGDIKDRLTDANKEYYRKITLMTSNKTLEDKSIRASEAAREVINAELKIRDEINRNINDKNVLAKIENQTTEQQYQILRSLLQSESLDENAKWQIRDALRAVNKVAGDYTDKVNKQQKAMKDLTKEQKINEEILNRLSDASNEYIIEKKKEIEQQKKVQVETAMSNKEMISAYQEYVANKKILDGETKTNFETYMKAKNANEKLLLNESFKNYVAYKESISGVFASIAEKALEKTKEAISKVTGYFSQAGSFISTSYSQIFDVVSGFMQNDLDAQQIAADKKISKLEDEKEQTLASIEDEYAQKKELLDQQLANDLISRGAYNEQSAELEQQKADAKAAAEADADNRIDAAKRANAKKLDKARKKQFEAEKGNQIAQAWIQFATGSVSAWASAAQWPGPSMVVGMALAGVLTALLLATTIANTVRISQQQYIPTALATGGSFDTNESLLVGERGPELLTPTSAGYVTPASVTDKILRNVSENFSGQTTNINMNGAFKGATISNAIDLKYVTKYVLNVLGEKLGLAR